MEEEDETQTVETHVSKSNPAALHKDTKYQLINEDECALLLNKETESSSTVRVYGTTSSPTHRMSSPALGNSVAVVTSTDSMMETCIKEESGCLALLKKFRAKGAYLLGQMLREEIIYLLGVLIVTMFNQTAIEVNNT